MTLSPISLTKEMILDFPHHVVFSSIKFNELLALIIFSELSIPQQFQLLTFREVLLKHFNNTLTFFHNN